MGLFDFFSMPQEVRDLNLYSALIDMNLRKIKKAIKKGGNPNALIEFGGDAKPIFFHYYKQRNDRLAVCTRDKKLEYDPLYADIRNVLIMGGMDIRNTLDSKGRNVLFSLTEETTVLECLNLGAKPDQIDKNGETVLIAMADAVSNRRLDFKNACFSFRHILRAPRFHDIVNHQRPSDKNTVWHILSKSQAKFDLEVIPENPGSDYVRHLDLIKDTRNIFFMYSTLLAEHRGDPSLKNGAGQTVEDAYNENYTPEPGRTYAPKEDFFPALKQLLTELMDKGPLPILAQPVVDGKQSKSKTVILEREGHGGIGD